VITSRSNDQGWFPPAWLRKFAGYLRNELSFSLWDPDDDLPVLPKLIGHELVCVGRHFHFVGCFTAAELKQLFQGGKFKGNELACLEEIPEVISVAEVVALLAN